MSSRYTNTASAQPYTLTKPKAQQIVNKSQENERPTWLTSQNNPILSRLSSISNAFKSIFVRPEEPVDLDSFKEQIEINNQEIRSISPILPVSIPEPRVFKRLQASAAHQHAVMLSLSSSNLISSTNKTQPILTNISNNSNKIVTTVTNNLPKWTCMICLSKHQIDVKICSICGSSNQDQVNVKPNSSFAMPATKYKQELATSVANGALKAINNNAVPNFLKTWLCHYCNFANDSLKVVCMNCRAGKKHNSTNHGVKLQHQSVQMKRLRAEMDSIKQPKSKQVRLVQVAKCGCDNLNKSNEENELDQEEDEATSSKTPIKRKLFF